MVLRLLVVVLTLVGAIPVRICTCGAHSHPLFAKPVSAPDRAPTPDLPSIFAEDPAPAEHHDHDCHFVKPRPLMSVGLQFDVADVPPADALAVALEELPALAPIVGHTIRDFHPPPNRPLFISYCVLRN